MFFGMNVYDLAILSCLILFVVFLVLSIGFLFTPRYKLERNRFFGEGVRIFVPYAANLCFYGSTLSSLLKHNNEGLRIENFYQLMFSTVEGFKFELRKELFIPEYLTDHILYNISGPFANIINTELFSIAMLVLYFISLLLFYSTAISILFDSLRNVINVRHKLYKGADIVIGDIDYEDYVRDYANTVIWLDPRIDGSKLAMVKRSGIPYINKEFRKDTLAQKLWGANDIKIIVIGDEERALEALTEFNKYYKENSKKRVELIAEVSYKHLLSIQESIRKGEYPDSVRLFNRYELLSINFNTKYPIAKSLPSNLYTEVKANDQPHGINVVKDDASINVIYLGFGKVNKALYDISSMNDILPTLAYEDGKYELRDKRINYYAYDRCADNIEAANKNSKNYDEFIQNSPDQEDYYGFIDSPQGVSNIYYSDVADYMERNSSSNGLARKYSDTSEIMRDELIDIINKPNSFTRIIISLNNGLDNVNDSLSLIKFMAKHEFKNVEIMVRVKKYDAKVYEIFEQSNVVLFGVDSDVLNHSSIINGKIYNTSKRLEARYASSKVNTNEWLYKSRVNNASNFYKTLNTRTKLNLLGYDLVLDKDVDVAESTLAMSDFIAEDKYREILNINDRLITNRNYIKSSGIYQLVFSDKILAKGGSLYKGQRLLASIEGFRADYSKINHSILNKSDKPNYYNVLGYQEHSRWNAFKLNEGTIPFAKEEKVFYLPTEFQCQKNDSDLNKHSCLTTFDELYLYHHDLKDLLLDGVNTYPNTDVNEAKDRIIKIIEDKLGIRINRSDNGEILNEDELYPIIVEKPEKLRKFIIEKKKSKDKSDLRRKLEYALRSINSFYQRKNKHTFIKGLCIPLDIVFFTIGLVFHGLNVAFNRVYSLVNRKECLNKNLYECIIKPEEYGGIGASPEKRCMMVINSVFNKINRAKDSKKYVYRNSIIYYSNDGISRSQYNSLSEMNRNYLINTPLAKDLFIFIERNIDIALHGVKGLLREAVKESPYIEGLYKADEYYQRAYNLSSPEFYSKVQKEIREFKDLKEGCSDVIKDDYVGRYGSIKLIKQNRRAITRAKRKIKRLMDIKYSSNKSKKAMMKMHLEDKVISREILNNAAAKLGLSLDNGLVVNIADLNLYTKLIKSDEFRYLAYVIDSSIMKEAELSKKDVALEIILKEFSSPNKNARRILFEIVKAIAANDNNLFSLERNGNLDIVDVYEQAALAQMDTFRYDYTLPTTVRDLCDKIELCKLEYKQY